MSHAFILLERDAELAIVTLNRPEKFNAWHSAMRTQLADALRQLNADPTVRALVLTGAGDKAFSAGQDLAEAKEFTGPRAITWMDEWSNLYGACLLYTSPSPRDATLSRMPSSA